MYSYLHSYILNYDASQTEGCPVQAVPYRDCYLVACVFYGFVGLAVFPRLIARLYYVFACDFREIYSFWFDLIRVAKKGEKTSKNAFLQTNKNLKKGKTSFLKYPEKNRNCRSEGRWHPAVPGSAGYPNTRGFAVPDPGPGKPLIVLHLLSSRTNRPQQSFFIQTKLHSRSHKSLINVTKATSSREEGLMGVQHKTFRTNKDR